MEEMDCSIIKNIEFCGIPVEVCDIILQKLTDLDHRNNARLVCTTWRNLIDRRCSNEVFNIRKMLNKMYSEANSILIRCQRKHITIAFDDVDIGIFNPFWQVRSADITSLCLMASHLEPSILKNTLMKCSALKDLSINCKYLPYTNCTLKKIYCFYCDSFDVIMGEKINFPSVSNLTLKFGNYYSLYLDSPLYHSKNEIFVWLVKLMRRMDIVFPSLKQIDIVDQMGLMIYQDFIPQIQSILPSLQFRIILRNYHRESIELDKICGLTYCINSADLTLTSEKAAVGINPFWSFSSEECLVKFMSQCAPSKLNELKIIVTKYNYKLHFPPKNKNKYGVLIWNKLNYLLIDADCTVIFHPVPTEYSGLKTLKLLCEWENIYGFDLKIIRLLSSSLSELWLKTTTYDTFLAICNEMYIFDINFQKYLEELKIDQIIDRDALTYVACESQNNIDKLNCLRKLYIPDYIRITEDITLPNLHNYYTFDSDEGMYNSETDSDDEELSCINIYNKNEI